MLSKHFFSICVFMLANMSMHVWKWGYSGAERQKVSTWARTQHTLGLIIQPWTRDKERKKEEGQMWKRASCHMRTVVPICHLRRYLNTPRMCQLKQGFFPFHSVYYTYFCYSLMGVTLIMATFMSQWLVFIIRLFSIYLCYTFRMQLCIMLIVTDQYI